MTGCKGAAPAECTCETLCTGEEINADCPVCSVEGAELDKVCVGVVPMLPVTALAAGEHDSHSNGWTELTADTTTLSGGSYYLSSNVEYTGTESITVSGEVILCLNGQKLDLKRQHISVGSGASFTLCDCSTGGVLTGGSGGYRGSGGGVYVDGGGTFTMTQRQHRRQHRRCRRRGVCGRRRHLHYGRRQHQQQQGQLRWRWRGDG